MGKKGKKGGGAGAGAGDRGQPSSSATEQPSSSTPEQPAQPTQAREQGAPPQQIPVETTVDTQPQQGGKKGKKGKKQQQTPVSASAHTVPKPELPAQLADVTKSTTAIQLGEQSASGHGQVPSQQQQQQPSAWGRGQPPREQQQQQPSAWGRGQPPREQQQQPSAWGRGQPPREQQQQQPSAWGRGQPPQRQQQPPHQQQQPPHQQQQPPHQQQQVAGGKDITPPPQQQQQPSARGRGQPPREQQQQQQPSARGRGQPPYQQQPSARGRGQTPRQQQQDAGVKETTPPLQQLHPGGRGRGQTPPPQGREQTLLEQQQHLRSTSREQTPTLSEQRQDVKRQDVNVSGHGGRGGGRQPRGQAPDSGMKQAHAGSGDQQSRPSSQGSVSQHSTQSVDSTGDKYQLAVYQRKNLAGGGTRGIPFKVETNHVSLNINPKLKVAYHYDVAINPDKPKRMMRRVWDIFRATNLRKYNIAFDDVKNAYSPDSIPDIAGEVSIAEDENSIPKSYSVCIKLAAEVDLCALFTYMRRGCVTSVPQEALQCLDIVLRNVSAMRFVRVGRSYFSQPHNEHIISLGDGLELWHGFFQSAIIGWKPFLNVDVAHKGFPKPQRVVTLMNEMTDQRGFDREKCGKFLKGLKVQYEMPNQSATRRTYRVNGFVDPPDRATFVQEGNRINIFTYYQRQKNYTIQERQLPCLWVGARDRHIYLPPELCTILPGQVINRKLNDIQTANMVRNAATDSNIRKQKIMNSLQSVQFNDDPVVKAFGLTIGDHFERVPARLLEPPAIGYKQRNIKPAKGVWRAAEFLNAENLPRGTWTVINLDRRTRDDSIYGFVQMLKQEGGQLGMHVEDPEQPFLRMERFDQRQFGSALQQHKNKKLIFVVVPDFPTNVYSKVKQISELEIGCVTQCIKSKTMFKMNRATVGNILLKVNAKLNGNNHTISPTCRPKCLTRPCMIMGADVTHPSPDQNDIPSVAAVTASCDATGFRYNFSWRLQPAKQEIIADLENIVKEQLLIFHRQTKCKPEKIIFFRDGVSEGQFREVMNMEVQAIRRACSSMGTTDTFKPQITFLVVQKRHHTRFFPTNRSESDDRNFNVRAGTVVDTEITHPTGLEYYLVSHASIQGVARPTKYRVLWDDSEMTEDDLEELTYYLCHMFSRCTRSVSYPAPTYYAHLAAFRARVYLEGHPINLGNLRQEESRRVIRDNIRRDQPMFYV